MARVLVALTVSLLVAVLAGWVAHFVPLGSPTDVSANGVIVEEPNAGTDPAADPTSPPPGSTVGLTSFVTSCGELLDVVPTEAVSRATSVQVTLEVHPVCPTGEWISSPSMRIDLTDSEGVPFAQGMFDFSDERLFVPGYGDATSQLTADFGPGTAWAAPESMAAEIANGSVHVDCVPLEDTSSEPLEDGETAPSPDLSVAATPLAEGTDTSRTALAALRRQARADDPSISELEGSWIPQLSSKTDGTYDALDGKSYSYADIWQQYLAFRLRYPNVRLLNSSDWNAYELDGYWVVIAGVPFIYPNQANDWCADRGIAPSQCFAKRLIRDGAPDGTTKHRG